MKVIDTALPGVKIIEPRVFGDHRGFFLETYNEARYREAGIDVGFVQDNHSRSARGILRGLHYQVRKPQAKLVWVVEGEVFDVAVDVREGSPSFGAWTGVRLSGDNHRQLFIPAGFAHGFCVLSESAHFLYKCSDLYDPGGEGGVIWNDPKIGIEWPLDEIEPVLSDKDAALPVLAEATLPVTRLA